MHRVQNGNRDFLKFKINFKMEKTYWTTKDGVKIDIDEMSIEHLRNTLKLIVRRNLNRFCPHNVDDAISLSDLEDEYDAEDYGCR